MSDHVKSPPDDDPKVEVPDGTDGLLDTIAAVVSATVFGSSGGRVPAPDAPTAEIRAFANSFDGFYAPEITQKDLNISFVINPEEGTESCIARCAAIEKIRVDAATKETLLANCDPAADRHAEMINQNFTAIQDELNPLTFEQTRTWCNELMDTLKYGSTAGNSRFAKQVWSLVHENLEDVIDFIDAFEDSLPGGYSAEVLLEQAKETPRFNATGGVTFWTLVATANRSNTELVAGFLQQERNRIAEATSDNVNPYFEPWAEPMTEGDRREAIRTLERIYGLDDTTEAQINTKSTLILRALFQITAQVFKSGASTTSENLFRTLDHLMVKKDAAVYKNDDEIDYSTNPRNPFSWLDFDGNNTKFIVPGNSSEASSWSVEGLYQGFTNFVAQWNPGAKTITRTYAQDAPAVLLALLKEIRPLNNDTSVTGEMEALLATLRPETAGFNSYPTYFERATSFVLFKRGLWLANQNNVVWERTRNTCTLVSSPNMEERCSRFVNTPGNTMCYFNDTQSTFGQKNFGLSPEHGFCRADTPAQALERSGISGRGLDETRDTFGDYVNYLIPILIPIFMQMINFGRKKGKIGDNYVPPLVAFTVGGIVYVSNGFNGIAIPENLVLDLDSAGTLLKTLGSLAATAVTNVGVVLRDPYGTFANPAGLAISAAEILDTLVQPNVSFGSGAKAFFATSAGLHFILNEMTPMSYTEQFVYLTTVLSGAVTMTASQAFLKPEEQLIITRPYNGVAIGTLEASIKLSSKLCVNNFKVWAYVSAMLLTLVRAIPEELKTLSFSANNAEGAAAIFFPFVYLAWYTLFDFAPALIQENEKRYAFLTISEVVKELEGIKGSKISAKDENSINGLEWPGLLPGQTLRVLRAAKTSVVYVYVGEGQASPTFTDFGNHDVRVTVYGDGRPATIASTRKGTALLEAAKATVIELDRQPVLPGVSYAISVTEKAIAVGEKFSIPRTRWKYLGLLAKVGGLGVSTRIVPLAAQFFTEANSVQTKIDLLEMFIGNLSANAGPLLVAPMFLWASTNLAESGIGPKIKVTPATPRPALQGPRIDQSVSPNIKIIEYVTQPTAYYTSEILGNGVFKPPKSTNETLFIWRNEWTDVIANNEFDDVGGEKAKAMFERLREAKNVIVVNTGPGDRMITEINVAAAMRKWKTNPTSKANDFIREFANGNAEVLINTTAVRNIDKAKVKNAVQDALRPTALERAGNIDWTSKIPTRRALGFGAASVLAVYAQRTLGIFDVRL